MPELLDLRPRSRDPLADKTALVTGAGSGIGRALAVELARRGAHLALVDVSPDGLAETAALLREITARPPLTFVADVRDASRCEAIIAELTAARGGLDVLINNAGLSAHGLAEATSLEVLRRVMDVNFYGAVHFTLAALPSLRQRRGRIAVMSSVAGFAPLFGRSAYAASKHALHGWFDTLRAELADTGVDITVVCPSFVATAIDRHALSGSGGAARSDKPTIGRPVSPELIAREVCDGLERRTRQLTPTTVATASLWLSRLAPRTYERLMRKSQASGY